MDLIHILLSVLFLTKTIIVQNVSESAGAAFVNEENGVAHYGSRYYQPAF